MSAFSSSFIPSINAKMACCMAQTFMPRDWDAVGCNCRKLGVRGANGRKYTRKQARGHEQARARGRGCGVVSPCRSSEGVQEGARHEGTGQGTSLSTGIAQNSTKVMFSGSATPQSFMSASATATAVAGATMPLLASTTPTSTPTGNAARLGLRHAAAPANFDACCRRVFSAGTRHICAGTRRICGHNCPHLRRICGQNGAISAPELPHLRGASH
jgi:hypothetical protein